VQVSEDFAIGRTCNYPFGWFKQACTTTASIDRPHLKEKALHAPACLGINGFQISNSWINHFKKRHILVYATMSGESVIVNPETVMNWKSEELPKIIYGCQLKDIINVDENGLFYNLQPRKMLTYKGDSCCGETKSSGG
jgi:hypothetical protein